MKAVAYTLRRVFFTGLAAILPLAVTIYILWWLGSTAEALFGGLVARVLPDVQYIPGMGIAAGLACVFAAGFLLRAWIVRLIFERIEALLERIPLVKTLYGSVRDLMGFFSSPGEGQRFSQVVMVELEGTSARVLGFVTREDFDELPEGIGGEGRVAVYLPMSYQIGGFTAIVPREAVRPVDMTMEEAMRFAVTAGLSWRDRSAPGQAGGHVSARPGSRSNRGE